MKPSIKIRRLNPAAKLPTRRDGDVGWDLYACTVESLTDTLIKVGTGIAMELPEGYWGQLENRSSMGKQGYDVHGGIVDNAYRGEIMVILAKHSPSTEVTVEPGSKIAQLIIRKQEDEGWELLEKEALSDTVRGADGFGSTGR